MPHSNTYIPGAIYYTNFGVSDLIFLVFLFILTERTGELIIIYRL